MTLPIQQPVAIFLIVLVIILLAPLILNRIKIPYIVGLIVAGILVGPYGFNILARDASFEIFGQVGILYLMCLAGIEIDMVNLRRNLKPGLRFGMLTFLLPFAGGLGVAHWILGEGWASSMLIASMLSSHTLISYPIISRFGLTRSRSAVVSVCGTIVAVLLALICLAAVAGISAKGKWGAGDALWLLAKLIAFASLSAWIVPIITRRFFREFSDSVTQYIYVMGMVLLMSLVASVIGLEAILGAFYAGLLLNRFIPERSTLLRYILFVGNAIFIPYFLIGVGMLINVTVVFNGPAVIIVAVVLTATSLCSKWLAAWIAQKMLGYSPVERKVMVGLTSGKAAATIAAVMVGFNYHLFGEDILNGAVVMILLCCIVASIVTQRAAIKLRMQLTEETLKAPDSEWRQDARQVVAVANPLTADAIMRLALMLRHPDCVVPVTAMTVRTDDDGARLANSRSALRIAEDVANMHDVECHTVERYDANVVTGIKGVMIEQQASEVIIGLHRKSTIVDTFYGTLTETLLRATNRMVMISRCYIPPATLRKIIVVVPKNAEYETGFRLWVERTANLAAALGCRIIFATPKETEGYIRGVLYSENYTLRASYIALESWDDFLLLSSDFEDDDLLVAVGARRNSISFSSELEALPSFLSKYCARQNLMVIYPEQFGAYSAPVTPIDPLAPVISSTPSPLLLSINRWRNILADFRRRHSRRH